MSFNIANLCVVRNFKANILIMTHLITIIDSLRNTGPYRMLDSAWDCALKLEGGLYQKSKDNIILRNTEGTLFIVSLHSTPLFKSTTYDLEAANFNIYEGSCPLFSFNLYEYKEFDKDDEFILASTMGGFQGSMIHFRIKKYSDEDLIKSSDKSIIEKAFPDQYTLPVRLGMAMQEATEIMKRICITSEFKEHKQWWYESGLLLMYNKEDIIETICFSRYGGIDIPTGLLYGVGIGDNIEECYKSWGNQLETKRKDFVSDYRITWKYKTFQIRTEFWNEDGKTVGGSVFKKDTVRGIMICEYGNDFPW